ncbi:MULTISPECIES: GntR family transcriptional regulator [unclassified Bacillus (in: firmicutes)]|uniref:GntR family transcriptional regulator n=1 Tax=unclassified Bacillus (in: firmicutes) TaxID=185979 RepID=UPI000BEF2D3C|nr:MULTISPECIES: GntR family transcriptional regulator [unclassified Bacillus (in: firmicutes)]PEJ54359.1 GntR family transcriptional regulator [Bacillus sp. AFS002410]PEL06751.1 GntR family transcriptional regulator [Bacillus sp. AFS017336]
MKPTLDESQPIFQQIAVMIMDEIIDGRIKEGEQVPSTNELSRFFNINPATARKGLQALVDKEIIFKQRGVGMFVSEGAKEKLILERKQQFYEEYVAPLLKEANRIHLDEEMVIDLIKRKNDSN